MEPLFEEGSEMESTRASSAFVDSMVAAPITEDPQNEDSSEDEEELLRVKEMNQFEGLCDGVLTSLGLVSSAVTELMELKDILMTQKLPPVVLSRIAVISSKVFRSISDLHMPTNELVRLVRIYSSPWEEKSQALKRLHEQYQSMKSQLLIALRKLQLHEGEAKRFAREKRILNWEKLFAQLTVKKGHGRRWKFLIEAFKKRTLQGPEALENYFRQLDQEGGVEIDPNEEQIVHLTDGDVDDDDLSDEELNQDEERNDDDEDGTSSHMSRMSRVRSRVRKASAKSARQQTTPVEKVSSEIQAIPDVEDNTTWTGEPQHDWYLHVRVFKPVLDNENTGNIQCSLQFGKQKFKTGQSSNQSVFNPPKPAGPQPGQGGKRRGLIGSRGGLSKMTEGDQETKFEEFILYPIDRQPAEICQSLQGTRLINIYVHPGNVEDSIASTVINTSDLERADLPIFDTGTTAQAQELSYDDKYTINSLQPTEFLLHKNNSSKSIGKLPLICYWTRKLKIDSIDQITESETLKDIVLDLTGIDLNKTTKEQLTVEMIEECLSAKSLTPVPQIEVVTKEDFDKMNEVHRDEINMVRQEYELRIQTLLDVIENMRLSQMQTVDAGPPLSKQEFSNTTKLNISVQENPVKQLSPEKSDVTSCSYLRRVRRALRPGEELPNWGEDLPQDFLERLQMFENDSNLHRQELAEKINKEVSHSIEKRLSDQNKLNSYSLQTDPLKDVSLPAVFMPTRSRNINIFNPKAHQYFHSVGTSNARMTQPPSMLHLPPLPPNKLTVLNLFDLATQDQKARENQWLTYRYLQQQSATAERFSLPRTPQPTMHQGEPIANNIP